MRMQSALALFFLQPLRALARNTLRSVLAGLSIMIGIGAVVCVVAIGRSGSKRAEQALQNLGNNFVWIEAGSRAPNGVRTGSHGTTSLTLEDARAIARDMPLIKLVSPNVDGHAQIVYGNRNWYTGWRGIDATYFEIRNWNVQSGSAFLADDVVRSRSLVLIGQTVKEKLFPREDPLGKVLRINEQLFEVTGVLESKGQNAMGRDQDDTVIVPWTAAVHKLRGRTNEFLDDILCSAVSPEAVVPAIEEVQGLLRQRHHIAPGKDDDFNIRRPDEVLKAQIETSHTLEALLISIAAIALVVGGIGVMNVMLFSVTERTREIGLRMAVGATERAVQLQFLGEAVLLTFFGGLLGLLAGAVACIAIGNILGWSMEIPPDALLVAPACSVAVGIFFGFYPAQRAARLDPIEALRHE
jgi:putative ABC transport system permease protein